MPDRSFNVLELIRSLGHRLNDAIHKAMQDPDVVKRFADQGMQAFPSTPAQFGNFMQAEQAKWGPLVKASGAVIE